MHRGIVLDHNNEKKYCNKSKYLKNKIILKGKELKFEHLAGKHVLL